MIFLFGLERNADSVLKNVLLNSSVTVTVAKCIAYDLVTVGPGEHFRQVLGNRVPVECSTVIPFHDTIRTSPCGAEGVIANDVDIGRLQREALCRVK